MKKQGWGGGDITWEEDFIFSELIASEIQED